MQNLLHDLLIIKIRLINTHQLILKFKNYSCLLPILSISHIKIYYQIIVDGFQELKYMPDKKLGLEFLLLKMVTINDKNKINDYSVIY